MAYSTRKFNTALKCSPIIPILCRINSISPNDTCFLEINSNIVLPSMYKPPYTFLSCRFICSDFESSPTFLHSGYMTCPS